MVSVSQASDIILSHCFSPTTEGIPIVACIGRVLAEPIFADRDFPAFDRVSMDGIAIAIDTFEKGQRRFQIEGVQPAGAPRKKLTNPTSCYEVMTGAILPDGTNTVIRYEDLKIENSAAEILIEDIIFGQNVHRKGTDGMQGDQVIEKDTVLSAAEIAVLASVGKDTVMCKKYPTIAIVTTGDELVPVDSSPAEHQIRSSNSLAIQAALRAINIPASTFHVQDDADLIQGTLGKIFSAFDVVIISGGVSKGKFDFVPEALSQLGIEKKFHGVKQRPGKPFWFGVGKGKTVFALPGNPVSTYICFYRYIKPWLMQSLGVVEAPLTAELTSDYDFPPALTHFLQVHVRIQQGKLIAMPDPGKGSGDFANLSKVTGFLELPENQTKFSAGEVFPYFPFRPF